MITITATQASQRLHSGAEIAFLDLREAGEFGEAHPLFAIPAPYSQLELRIAQLVPRLAAPIMLLDGGDGIAQRGAARLEALGYSDVSVIADGMSGWRAAGLGVYKGVNVPSKTLGELAEHVWHPDMLTPEALADWQRNQTPFLFYDARPPAEYAKMRVPGARCLPNGELAHRITTQTTADGPPVVITCAGRTRGIIGAIGLRLSGFQGPIFALENGTQGWALAGETLERGNPVSPYPTLSAEDMAASHRGALAMAERFSIPVLNPQSAAALLQDTGRTTYLLDTRSADEAISDPIRGAVNAPGGQLVQATDQWVGLRNARMILCCDTGMRSAIAAFWLRQMGYDAQILVIDDALRSGVLPAALALPHPQQLSETDAASALAMSAAPDVRVLDLRGSMAFRKEHVVGAQWAIRPRLDAVKAALLGVRHVLMIEDTAGVAALVVGDLSATMPAQELPQFTVVAGGHAALVQAGAAVTQSAHTPADADAIDHLFFVHDRHDGNLAASRQYLAWETGLIAQLSTAERAEYRLYQP